jgi:protein-S-isoprenylcysteine O-methyltransferase Ste14
VRAFLIPLLAGFVFNAASAFTAAFCGRWGARRGQLVTAVLRSVLGIPVWVIGLGLAVRTPSPMFFTPSAPLEVVGWLLLGLGSVVQLLALAALRGRAATPSVRDTLVQRGPHAHLRHPMHAGLLLEFAALVLVKPSHAVGLACALGVGWVLLQGKLEELDLLERLPPYREYMTRVPRFVPRLRRRS